MTRLGVLGWPVAHSRSPAIHNAALQALGLSDWRYQLLPVPPELFAETVRALGAAGFRGANVTIPHKENALRLADDVSPTARSIGAVNTLLFDPGRIVGENTDGPALLDLIRDAAEAPTSGLILGAGGSARAAAWALRAAGVAEVAVWNRSPQRAHRLAEEIGARAVTAPQGAGILVNCTPLGVDGERGSGLPLDADALRGYGLVIDLAYAAATEPLAQAARREGVASVDGLEVLLAQAVLSLERFAGRPAPVAAMREALRAAAQGYRLGS